MPQFKQGIFRPDARAHEDRWRADRARCDRDSSPVDRLRLAIGVELHAERPVVCDQHPVDETMRPDDEIAPFADGQKVGDRGREAETAAAVLWEGADTGGLGMVMVSDLVEAEAPADLKEGELSWNQLISAPAADRDWAASPVQLFGPIRVSFQATKGRQHLRPAPGLVAQRRPLLVVGRHAPQSNCGIDGRRSADHSAARIGNRSAGHGLRAQPPVVRLQRHPPGILKIARRGLERRIVRACLEQQDAAGRFLRQPSSEHGTGRTASHDDVVVLHGSSAGCAHRRPPPFSGRL